MHELAIATDIVEIVLRSAENSGAHHVDVVELEIGELAGIETEALDMALKVSVKNTLMDGVEIRIDHLKGEAHCFDCGKINPVDDLFSICPHCGSYRMDITRGKEMKIKSIIISKP